MQQFDSKSACRLLDNPAGKHADNKAFFNTKTEALFSVLEVPLDPKSWKPQILSSQ